jgi:hypothetical protein
MRHQIVSISEIRYALKSTAVDPNLRDTGGVALMSYEYGHVIYNRMLPKNIFHE